MIAKETIEAMWADYSGGISLNAVGRKHGRDRRTVRELFERRGLKVRPLTYTVKLLANGQFAPAPAATAAELEGMIAKATRVQVPLELAREWRLWKLNRRMWFIGRLRNRFPSMRPKGPFSTNLTPFDYGTPAAREIVKRMNIGRNSRNKLATLKPCSEGVIFEGKLYFWVKQRPFRNGYGDGYFEGNWKPGRGRRALHRIIWEKLNGRKVPEGFTVIHKDGNKNNLHPGNLGLRSREDCAAQNSVWTRLKRDPQNPRLIALANKCRAASIADKRRLSLERTALLLERHRAGAIRTGNTKKESNNGNINHELVRRLVA